MSEHTKYKIEKPLKVGDVIEVKDFFTGLKTRFIVSHVTRTMAVAFDKNDNKKRFKRWSVFLDNYFRPIRTDLSYTSKLYKVVDR